MGLEWVDERVAQEYNRLYMFKTHGARTSFIWYSGPLGPKGPPGLLGLALIAGEAREF